MIADAIDAYRLCDPATEQIDDRSVLDPMLQRRLDWPAGPVGDAEAEHRTRHLLPTSSPRRAIVVAGCAAALALGGLVVAACDDGDDRPSGIAPEPVASMTSPTVTPTDPPIEDLVELRALATDAVADDFLAAINSSSSDDALALLSPESDCNEPMQPDAAQETCGQYWVRQIAIGAEISLIQCGGVGARRCSLVLRSEQNDMAYADPSRTGTVKFRLDDEHRLVFGWVDRPTNG